MQRRIMYSPEFDSDCLRLGGIAAVQACIAPLVEALEKNPYAFSLLDTSTQHRYAVVRPVGRMPELLVVYSVDDAGDVMMGHVRSR